MILVHISDLHFGRTSEHVLASLSAWIDAENPDLVIISGDFTQNAFKKEWKLAEAFVGALRMPWMAVPGNHDLPSYQFWERTFLPFARYKNYIQRDLMPTFENDEVAIVGINTARRWGCSLDWSRGRVSPWQLMRVHGFFSGQPESRVKMLFAHHPFLLPDIRSKRHRLVGRFKKAVQTFRDAGIDIVLAGHLHQNYSGWHECEGGGHRIYVAQASTAISTRLKGEPNAFNVFDIRSGSVSVAKMSWDGERFARAETDRFDV